MASSMPLRSERGAPTFDSTDPRELALYFKELELLFEKHKVGQGADKEKKSWALFYLPISVNDDWEMLPSYADPTKTWEDFKNDVRALYPGSQVDERYTRADLDNHIATWRQHGVATLGDWAAFYRTYQAISVWLISKKRLSEYEQSQRAFKVLPPPILAQIQQRLMIKFPDHNADDPYKLEWINQAAGYVLRGNSTSVPFPQANPSGQAHGGSGGQAQGSQQSQPPPQVKTDSDGIAAKLDALTRRIDQLTTRSNAPATDGNAARMRPGGPLATFTCHYCGRVGHGLSNCQDVASDISQGYIMRDASDNNRIKLPNGRSPPINSAQPNETMRQRVHAWHNSNPGQRIQVVGSNFVAQYAADPEFQEDAQGYTDGDQSVSANTFAQANVMLGQIYDLSAEQRLEAYKQTLETMEQVQRAQLREGRGPQGAAPPRPTTAPPIARATAPPDVGPRAGPSAPKSVEKEQSQSAGGAKQPYHPFAKVRDATFVPGEKATSPSPAQAKKPEEKELGALDLNDPAVVDALFNRILQAPAPVATMGEIFNALPELRQRWKDRFLSQRATRRNVAQVNLDTAVGDEMAREWDREELEDLKEGGEKKAAEGEGSTTVSTLEFTCVGAEPVVAREQDEAEVPRFPAGAMKLDGRYVLPPVQSLKGTQSQAPKGKREEVLQTGAPIVPLRSVVAVVNHAVEVECIVDPGCQIVAMSEKVASVLGLPWDPREVLHMQSANGSSNSTLGVARDVAFNIGGVPLWFQVHVVREAAYDVLLGRPFDELTKSVVQNLEDGIVTITMQDPNTGRVSVVPTFERGKCLFHGKNLADEERDRDSKDFQ